MTDRPLPVTETVDGDTLVVSIGGSLDIRSAVALRDTLRGSLERSERVAIDLAGATAIDVSGLQLVCAAHRSAVARKRHLVLRGVSEPVGAAARTGGLWRHRGCVDGCLWSAEGGPGEGGCTRARSAETEP